MFKAVNSQNGNHIIILDPEWADKVEYLRSLDRKDRLICQRCKQPVRVKAGRQRRWHFAHKHLKDCPLQNESPTLLAARASLYSWLISKFDASVVTLEKELDQDFLPRSIDCWVETKLQKFAYWIVESQIKPQQRDEFKRGFERLGIQINWVFLTSMLNENEEEPGQIFLSTTERVFMHESEYNFIDQSFETTYPRFSLHYLDHDSEILTTFRSLQIVHDPQLFAGRRLAHELSEMLVLGKTTGELIHPGEYEQLQEWKQAKVEYERKREAEERKRIEEAEKRRQQWLDEARRWSDDRKESSQLQERKFRQENPPYPVTTDSSGHSEGYIQAMSSPVEEAVCELCGTVVTQWYAYDNKTKKCKCMDCYRRLSAQT